MINISEVIETNRMIQNENLDVRTITMGISLLDCASGDVAATCRAVREKLMRYAGSLVKTGEDIACDFGIPIVNKRISVTPISIVGASCCSSPEDFVQIARTLVTHQTANTFLHLARRLVGECQRENLPRLHTLLQKIGYLIGQHTRLS